MTLFQLVSALKGIALTSPYIRSTFEGSIYDNLNANPHIKYGAFVISQTEHRQDEIFDYYGFNIFVCDRLEDDLEANRLHIQSVAKDVLANTILTLEKQFYGITHNELIFHPFTERFADLTAGQYVQVNFRVPKSLICPDIYEDKYGPDYRLQELEVTVTNNGVFEYTPDEDEYDGFKSIKLTVDVPQTGHTDEELQEAYDSGVTDGIIEQKNKLIATAITENGNYGREDGFNSVLVNIDTNSYYNSGYTDGYGSGSTDGYNSGKTEGVAEQKAKLISTAITVNGTYTKEDGYSAVTVNVPQTGTTINNQQKTISITANTATTVTYDSGYTGLEDVSINVNIDTQAYYNSGYTDGEADQKARLSSATFVDNNTYRLENGWNEVTVNVNTQEYYNSGYTDGYSSGVNEQKAKLVSTAITDNGTYTKEDGYSAVTVNIDTQAYYNSGYTQAEKDMQDRYTYLTFVAEETGNIVWGCVGGLSKTIYYSKNGGEWTSITSSSSGENISVVSGDIVRFRGDNSTYGNQYNGYSHFRCGSLRYKIYGNPNSLIDSCQFGNITSLTDTYTFSQLFYANTGLDIAENHNLYLSATGLTQNCYDGMFTNCSSLTKAPLLPAKTLVENCYSRMFSYCTSLTYIKCLATTLGNSSTYQWLASASATGTFVKAKNVTWPRNNNGIPSGWTVIEE